MPTVTALDSPCLSFVENVGTLRLNVSSACLTLSSARSIFDFLSYSFSAPGPPAAPLQSANATSAITATATNVFFTSDTPLRKWSPIA
jgi:hypothetical protein